MRLKGISKQGMSRLARSIKGQDADKANYVQYEIGTLNTEELIRVQLQDDSGGSTKWLTLDQETYDAIGTLLSSERFAKKATVDEEIWDMADKLREVLGDEQFINELLKAMSHEEAVENLQFIAQNWDISLSDREEY